MIHLKMVYYGAVPYYFAGIFAMFGILPNATISSLLFFHVINMINWICGYHWTLAMQSVQNQTIIASSMISILSLWATYTYCEEQYYLAQCLASILLLFQLYGDFRSDVTFFINPHMKLARIMNTMMIVYCLLRLM